MEFEWDEAKELANYRKHGVLFSEAAASLLDFGGLSRVDPDSVGESRMITLGADLSGRVLVTVSAVRANAVRIISSRPASRGERGIYEEGL
jgi:uncharacterized DUF497 family protein